MGLSTWILESASLPPNNNSEDGLHDEKSLSLPLLLQSSASKLSSASLSTFAFLRKADVRWLSSSSAAFLSKSILSYTFALFEDRVTVVPADGCTDTNSVVQNFSLRPAIFFRVLVGTDKLYEKCRMVCISHKPLENEFKASKLTKPDFWWKKRWDLISSLF